MLKDRFLEAGAEIIETSTYQMSYEGFRKHLSLDEKDVEKSIRRAVHLAKSAIDKFGMVCFRLFVVV